MARTLFLYLAFGFVATNEMLELGKWNFVWRS